MAYKIIHPNGAIEYYNSAGCLLKVIFNPFHKGQTNKGGIYCSYSHYYDCNGNSHREDGPAVDNYDITIYFKHGKKHRLDGPAYCNYQEDLFYPNKINTIEEWWYEGIWIENCENLEQFQRIIKLKAFW